MVDNLRKATQELEAPICPKCLVEMKWYSSTRVSQSPLVVEHAFTCDGCGRLARTKTTIKDAPAVPPSKLSMPLRQTGRVS